MNHIGLFEGIGGFSLAAQWMNWETIAWCENEPFCRQVLSYYFSNADKLGDIYNEDFKKYKGKCDILTGGFPCQPFSIAGSRAGTNDDRFLWGEMLRAIIEVSPTWVVAENVRGLLSIEQGTVFETVCSDLESAGYEVLTFIIPAASVNAPHKRERLTKNSSFNNPKRASEGCALSWGRENSHIYQVFSVNQLSKHKVTINMTTGKEQGYKSPTGRYYVIRGSKLISCWKISDGKFTTTTWARM